MSIVSLERAKSFLDVIHDADDVKLQMLLDAAEEEALQFMNRKTFSGACVVDADDVNSEPTAPDTVNAGQTVAVLLLLQAVYQATPDDADKLRKAAEIKLWPYRCGLGV